MSRILSAVAWPYANGPRHIGHVAGFGVPSDVFSRYMRMAGHEVLMVSGTDEHGTPILVAADEAGITARQLADKNNRLIVEDLVALGLSYDLFTRTTTGNHYQTVQKMFEVVRDNGYMLVQTTRGAISPSNGRTLPDRYIEGTCPICGTDGARGDQCDSCGNQLDPTDLINPVSRINGETPKFVETDHYFLDLPALAKALEAWLDDREQSGTWRPNVIKFSKNFLEDVRPRAMTRDIDWGIPVPGWEDQPGKRLYVWFDAVIGYLSASIEWARRTGDPEAWRKWWNDPEALSYYFMGKDNIVFHSQIWPAELIGYNGKGDKGGQPGDLGELNLPTEVVSSEFLTMEGKKFASSRGIVIYVRDMLERYQADALRYFISAAGPENSDADFTWAEFVRRTNSELVAGWGNLVNRTAAMIAKNFGEIPTPGPLEQIDEDLLKAVRDGFAEVGDLIAHHRQKAAIAQVMRLVGEANKYVTVTEPFKMKDESQRERLATVLHTLATAVVNLNLMLSPFLPFAANAVDQVFGGEGKVAPLPQIEEVTDLDITREDGSPLDYPIITGDYTQVPTWAPIEVTVGTPIAKPKPVFQKLDEAIIEEELERYGNK
ncbi:methionine--tRNA ligase [Boudabousia liubingyangii]|uniref:Methionine--tRNA ligase n=1 Tax=Boudabousia liubingyangii TaxID=1921764 RepID=A0A1Q5PJK8_9ACTO|nr:methionine--tRNA ligase [Boudabousia liubingyangii]OKL46116.1 methionine--tRNA ligase [Boudabousia liubingyangii]OKL46259.1 methionine--tRNA ligase [Boudabousia liubingyangii]